MGFRWEIICILTVLVASSVIISTNTEDLASDETLPSFGHFLPAEWESMCSVQDYSQKDVHVQCRVNTKNSGKWRLDTLRNWTSSSNVSYHINVQCTSQTNVSVPWPIKAKNLVDLKISGCYIIDYFANPTFGNVVPEVEDQLINLQLIDSEIVIDVLEWMHVVTNIEKLSKDFICGPEDTIVDIVKRNMSNDFMDITHFLQNDTTNSTYDILVNRILDEDKQFVKDNRKIPHKCNFTNLKYVDNSIRSPKSKIDIDFKPENSLYDEVRVYNYSYTGQTKIDSHFIEWWIYFPKLEVLDLSYNYISTFDLDSTVYAWYTPAVLHMNLTHNNFTRITTSFIHQLTKIKNLKIDLEGNPFNCGCSPEMKKVVELVQNPAVWKNDDYSRYEDFRLLKCATPESARGKPFIILTQSDMSCKMTSYVPIIILSFLVAFLVVILILITRYRREIQILTYTRFNVILPCQPYERFQDKSFDAFISYSSEDEVWVNKTFKSLEKEDTGHCFRFCLHQRDFIAGKTIFDNVIDSVEASRHTVIILSKHFIKSHWCLYEFHEAFQQSIIERKKHLLVVILEDIPEDDLPKELKRCLKTFTYIRKDDIIFHDRLIYALSFKGHKQMFNYNDNKTGGLPIEPNGMKTDSPNCYTNFALETD